MTQFTYGHALIIGAGGDLPHTVNDAIGLAEILTDHNRCAYPAKQVQRLTGPDAHREAILAGLTRLAEAAGEGSTVIIFFSGHGYEIRTTVGTREYFLMPHDYRVNDLPGTAVSGRELSDALWTIPAGRLLLLLDCCHAGGLDALKAPGMTFTKAPLPADAAEALASGRGRVVIASSRADEVSFAGKPYSAFTRALLEALCGRGASRHDGFVHVADLALHAREMVPQRTGDRQHPILNYEAADNFPVAYYAGGDYKPKELPFPEEAEIEPEPGAFRGAPMTDGISYQATATDHSTVAQGTGAAAVGARGVNIRGNVGGHVVTGDGNVVAGGDATTGIGAVELERLFAPLHVAVATAPPEQRAAAAPLAAELQEEAAKGEKADDGRLARLIEGLVDLVPTAVSGIVSAFASPILGSVAGPVTQYVLGKIQRW